MNLDTLGLEAFLAIAENAVMTSRSESVSSNVMLTSVASQAKKKARTENTRAADTARILRLRLGLVK